MKALIKKLNQPFFRFLIVGGINTIFGYGLFAFFIYLNLHYSVASLLSTILGVLFNFKTTGKLVFNSSDNRLIVRFFAVYGMVYLVNVGLLKGFQLIGLNVYIAGAILVLPLAILSFLLNRKFVFKK
ncbi:GtrA family protein [Paenibacillus psychroresistens]|uniref:GtrA family protein n=1 Tax=Paenibacillus psychroresistens TaxID=1778678 RepID=A0A6B8RRM6_9BACL|nr:GtrA family protein [Paenibacillus psychroresistens]QGQ98464.1 GtrA family protein [Paenibacillus psychroresistens]